MFYGLGLKVGQVVQLEVADYSSDRAEMTVPKTGRAAERCRYLVRRSRCLMRGWSGARSSGIRRFAPLFCTYQKPDAGRRMREALILDLVTKRARRLGIKKRVTSESLRASGQAHRSVDSLERQVLDYRDQPTVQARYPRAYETWKAAQALATLDASRHATKIGHDCREALGAVYERTGSAAQRADRHEKGDGRTFGRSSRRRTSRVRGSQHSLTHRSPTGEALAILHNDKNMGLRRRVGNWTPRTHGASCFTRCVSCTKSIEAPCAGEIARRARPRVGAQHRNAGRRPSGRAISR